MMNVMEGHNQSSFCDVVRGSTQDSLVIIRHVHYHASCHTQHSMLGHGRECTQN